MDRPLFTITANNAIRSLFAIIGATKQLPTVEFLPKDGNTLIGFLSEDRVFEVYTTTKIVVPKPMATTPADARATHWRTLKEIEFYHDGIVFVFPDDVERFKYETPLELEYEFIEGMAKRNSSLVLDAKGLKALDAFLKKYAKDDLSIILDLHRGEAVAYGGSTKDWRVTVFDYIKLPATPSSDKAVLVVGAGYLYPVIHEARMNGARVVKVYPMKVEDIGALLYLEAFFPDGSVMKVAIAPRMLDEDNPVRVFYERKGRLPTSMEELKEPYEESVHEVNKVFGELKERIKEVEELYNKILPKLEELYRASPPGAWPKFSNMISVEHTLRQLKIDRYKIDDLRKSSYWLSEKLDKCRQMSDPEKARACAESILHNYAEEIDKMLRELKAWEEFINLPGENYAEKLKNLGERIVSLLVERCGHARDMNEMARCAGEDEEIEHLMWVLNVANAATGTEDMYEMALEKTKGRAEKPAKEGVVHNSPVGWERAFKLVWEELSPKEKNIFVALFGDIDSFLFAVRNSDEDEGTQRALTTIFEAMKNHKIDELYREFEQAIVKNPQLPPAKIIKNVLGGEFIPRGLLAFIQSYKSSLHLPASLEIALRRAGMLNKVGKAYKVPDLNTRQFANFFEWLITAERRGIGGDVEVTPEGLLWISADKTVVLLVRTNTHLTKSHSLDLVSIADVLASDSLSKRFVEDLHRAWFYMLFDKGGHFIGIAILSGDNAYIVSAEPLELRLKLPRPNLNDMSNLRIDGNDIRVVTRYLHYKPAIFVSTHLGRDEKGFVADIWKTKKGYNVKEFEVGVVATPRESALYSTALSWVAGEVMRWWQGAGGVAIYSKGWFNHTYIFPVASYGALGDDVMIYVTPDVSVEEFVRERWFAKKPKVEGAEKPAEEKPTEGKPPIWAEKARRIIENYERYGKIHNIKGAVELLREAGRYGWVQDAYKAAKVLLPCVEDECKPTGDHILHELIVEALKPDATATDVYNTAKILAKQYKNELEKERLLKSGGELITGGLVRVVLYQEGLYPPDMLNRYLNEFFEQAEKYICNAVRPNGGICYKGYLEDYGPEGADDNLNADIRNFEMEGDWGKQIADLLRLSREVHYAKNLPLKDKILLFDKVVHAEHLSGSIFGDVDVPTAKKVADKIIAELEQKLPALLRMARNYSSPDEFARTFGIATADIKLYNLKDRLRARKKELMDFNRTKEAGEVGRLERMLPEAPLTLREVWEMAKFGEAEEERPPETPKVEEKPTAPPKPEPREACEEPSFITYEPRPDGGIRIKRINIGDRRKAKTSAWAKLVTHVDVSRRGGYAFEGQFLPYTREVDVPNGAWLVVSRADGSWRHPHNTIYLIHVRNGKLCTVEEANWPDEELSFKERVAELVNKVEEEEVTEKLEEFVAKEGESTPQEEGLRFIRTKLTNAYEAEMKLQGFPGERAPEKLIDDLARKVYAGELQQVEAMVKVLSEAKRRAADLKLQRVLGKKPAEVVEFEKPEEEKPPAVEEKPKENVRRMSVEDELREHALRIARIVTLNPEKLVECLPIVELAHMVQRGLTDIRTAEEVIYFAIMDGRSPEIICRIDWSKILPKRGKLDLRLVEDKLLKQMRVREKELARIFPKKVTEEEVPEVVGAPEEEEYEAPEEFPPVKLGPQAKEAGIKLPKAAKPSTKGGIPPEFFDALGDPAQVAEMVWYGVLGWAERHGVKGNPPKMASELLKAEKKAAENLPSGHLRTELIREVLMRTGTKFALRGVREAIQDLPWLKQAFYSKFPHRCLRQAIEDACICEEWGDIWYEPERRNCDGEKHSVFIGLLYASVLQLIEKMGGDIYAVPDRARLIARLSAEGIMRECGGGR